SMRIFILALVPLALVAVVQGFSITNCAMTPQNDEDNPVPERETVSLDCSFESTVESCLWVHDEPLNVGTHTGGTHDIKCSAGSGENGQNCQALSRVQYTFQDNRCGIRISGTEPEDTGKWKLSAIGLSSSGSGVQTATRDFELFTFNQSTLVMTDEDDNDLMGGTFETDYNCNERENDWEEGKSNWETVTFRCLAYGGRPEPTFKWYIDNNDNNELSSESHFRINTNLESVDDKDQYIRNLESEIEFQVDDKLMEILEQNNVEINSEDERVSFRLTCEIEQGTSSFVDSGYINLDINKSYDNGILPASTIGMIVGIVLAVLLLVIVAALVLFAKASGTLCFSDGRGRHEPVGAERF
ncbi:hypothetical protein TCAL_16383, partial [Tigriopus californicus]